MSTPRERRIIKELADIQADKDNSGVYAEPINENNLLHLKGSIPGPPDSPYFGGKYQVDIVIPDNYPFKSPVMRFETKIWHPNISSQTGAICLDTLGSGWSPVQTVKTALLSLRMLLEFPNPSDPQDAEVAKMMLERPEDFTQKAHEWAIYHAGAPRNPKLDLQRYKKEKEADSQISEDAKYQGYHRDLVGRFTSMGFPVEAVVDAFKYVGIETNDGEDYELEEAYMGDITARLLGEH
ncbi:ubiquitin-conjugating enzyme [Plectosphaerella cucumerina]|uniref:Ubiquitin-conjugating enzyme E2 2 n=1 Tax=Plectosphaerella cucumerina TaxID=40658 RepID=A0A8K0X4K1_9PEZI|nr:ubiquitin-conjugating enzyme [Plectosphaerella cucumerina]